MSKLGHLEPNRVFHFFEEMCGIPHGSGNTAQMTAYLMKFAAERGLEARSDATGNVIMRKPASAGYEKVPGIIIQGHMDMVAVKTPDSTKDMKTEGLDLAVDGDYIYAVNTSLGGDDGIAVAYGLAIMDDDSIRHPEIELIITVDEETGMFGAKDIDVSDIKGRRFLNIDSEEEGTFLASCAGGIRVQSHFPINRTEKEGIVLSVAVKGLQGGHSGAEIHKERGNALSLLNRTLYHVWKEQPFCLLSMQGGLAENAIPREAVAELLTEADKADNVLGALQEMEAVLKAEYATRDSALYLETEKKEHGIYCVCPLEETERFLKAMTAVPNGVQAMSPDMPGLVETSLNLGIIHSSENEIRAQYSLRSSVTSAKFALAEKLEAIFSLAGAEISTSGEYPGWAYRVDSPLRDKMIRIYADMFGEKPEIQAIHAGLECGLFLGKQPEFDCISFGPNLLNIHTTEEKMSISSVQRMWRFLLAVLEDKA